MLKSLQLSNISCIKPSTAHYNNSEKLPSAIIKVTQASYRKICMLMISSVLMVAVTGCGQKGDLYLVDTSSQTVKNSSDALESTSNPQDASFANVSEDPNDY